MRFPICQQNPLNLRLFCTMLLTLLGVMGCDFRSPDNNNGAVSTTRCAVVRQVTSDADLVPGPLARGRMGDFVIENAKMRAIIQQPGRNWFSIAQFGGNIIDASLKNPDGSLRAEDHYEESVLGTNIESAPNYQTVEIINAGGENPDGSCNPAIIRFTGPDDLLDFVNGSSAIRDLGFMFPNSADDVDLASTMQVDYTLEVDNTYVTMDTRLLNASGADENIYMVEYMNGAGEVELFQYGYGFGEVLITSPCDDCRFALYAGHEGGAGVSYGIIHNFPSSTSLSVSGVTIQVYGSDALPIALGTSQPPFTVPAGGELLVRRWFAVGDGSVSSILDIKHELLNEPTGVVEGRVVDANGPVANAEISVISPTNNFDPIDAGALAGGPATGVGIPRGPNLIVANHFRTDADGRYTGTLEPGDYELRVNVPNRLAAAPATANITVAADQTITVPDFVAPLPGRLQVSVSDQNNNAIAATVQLVGSEASPDANEPLNGESVAGGLLTTESGIFGDPAADPTASNIVFTEFAVADPAESGPVMIGVTDVHEMEPGTYQLSVSHGPRYSEYVQQVTLSAGQLTSLDVKLVEVVPTPGHIFGDFHVHAFNSPDSEVTNRERIATYLAENLDFFTPSDHGMRVDFSPVVNGMSVAGSIATAPSAEMTTFDYGHLNAWPVAIENNPASDEQATQSDAPRTSQGSVDWGNPEDPGTDFPSNGNFGLTPGEIFTQAKADPVTPGREVVQQINHIEGHFGPLGLSIDTGVNPPQSAVDGTAKRLDPSVANYYSDNYEALELWIGTDGRVSQFTHLFNENLGDWFNLINQGRRKTAASSSDTHQRRVTGMNTRNTISVPAALLDSNGRPNYVALQNDPHAVADSFRAGRSTMQGAPYVTAKIRNAAGQLAGLEVTDNFGIQDAPLPLAAPAADTTLELSVRAPTWAAYDQIAVFINGQTQPQLDDTGLQNATPPRYDICAAAITLNLDNNDFTRNTVIVASIDGFDHQRFETDLNITLPSPGIDYSVIVMVRGRDGVSPPMFPVVPSDFTDSGDGATVRSAGDTGIPALTISNPIFVDANGDGSWQAPGVQVADGTPVGQLAGNNCTIFDAPDE